MRKKLLDRKTIEIVKCTRNFKSNVYVIFNVFEQNEKCMQKMENNCQESISQGKFFDMYMYFDLNNFTVVKGRKKFQKLFGYCVTFLCVWWEKK